jgi:hypothetical protein
MDSKSLSNSTSSNEEKVPSKTQKSYNFLRNDYEIKSKNPDKPSFDLISPKILISRFSQNNITKYSVSQGQNIRSLSN